MDSPYRINNQKKKTPKQKPPNVTENISTNENTKSVANKTSKNNVMKGCNISDMHTISGKELIDQTLQNDKANSNLENKQEHNTKFITIARKMVNNS